MRFARLAAFALWLTIALLAVTGFAAFSPETVSNTSTSTSTTPPVAAGADWGSASGRVVALAFTSGLRAAPGLSDQSAEDALISEILGPRPAVIPAESDPEPELDDLIVAPTTTIPRTTTTTVSPPTTVPPSDPTPTVVAPTTTTTVPPAGGRLSEAEARGIISLFFAPADVELALEVSYCESRWDPDATNPTSSAAGLFQHLPRFWADRSVSAGWAGANIYDAHANAAVSAWLVYEGGGWSHWTASRACWG